MKNILVCLDLTYIDPVLIEYAAYFAEITGAGKVYFLHVIQEYDLPDKGGRDLPDEEAIYETIYRQTKKEVDDHFGSSFPTGIETRIEAEDASEAIIGFISETETDLVLIGHKSGTNREARYGFKIATGADCDILFVTEQAKSPIENILCAIDCSKESRMAFNRALALAETTGAALASYLLLDTARSYFPATTVSGASAEKERLKKQYAKFLESLDRTSEDIPCHYREVDPAENQAEKVYEVALEEKSDLVVVGASGDISASTTLLGNIALNLNNMDSKIPIMVIKNKKSKRFFWI